MTSSKIFGMVITCVVITCMPEAVFAGEGSDFVLRKHAVSVDEEKPPSKGPEARAIAFLELLKARKFDEAKKMFFAKSISKKDSMKWGIVDLKFADRYDLDKLIYWGITEERKGLPVVMLIYKKSKSGTKNMYVPMVKEDNQWKVGGFY